MGYFLMAMTAIAFRSSYIMELLFCGAIALLAIFIFFLFVKSKERLYLYYFLFLGFTFMAVSINVFHYDWAHDFFDFSTGSSRRNLEFVTLLGLCAYCLFTLRLLNVKEQDIRLYKWIVGLALITFVYACFYWGFYDFIKPYEATFFVVSRLAILPMSLIAIVGVSYRIQTVFKNYFIVGSVFYLAGALIGTLRETFAEIPIPYFYELTASAYFYLGIFFEIICFTLALNHRVYLIHQRQKQESEDLKNRAQYERDLALVKTLGSHAQSNPHFIFNQFSAIKYLIQRKENDKAIKLLTIYSRFMRQVLESNEEQKITLKREIDILRQYLRLESLRMERNFIYEFEIDPTLEMADVYIPPITLQPYIEPLIWRDFRVEEPQKKHLRLEINKREDQVIVNVLLSTEEHCHQGDLKEGENVKINNERLDIYNRSHRDKINVFRKDKRNKRGALRAILLIFYINM